LCQRVQKDFIACYNPSNRPKRTEIFNAESNPEGRWRKFTYDEIVSRDKQAWILPGSKIKALPISTICPTRMF
jgi:type I restriction enzyme M protein